MPNSRVRALTENASTPATPTTAMTNATAANTPNTTEFNRSGGSTSARTSWRVAGGSGGALCGVIDGQVVNDARDRGDQCIRIRARVDEEATAIERTRLKWVIDG